MFNRQHINLTPSAPAPPALEASHRIMPRSSSAAAKNTILGSFHAIKLTTISSDHERSTSLHLTNIPIEIYLLILDHLSPLDALCLKLTCKRLWAIGPLKAQLSLNLDTQEWSLDQKVAFLSRLAFDSPLLFFCHSCMRLHQRRRSWIERASALSHGWKMTCQKERSRNDTLWLCPQRQITYETIARIWKVNSNRRFARKKKRLPLSALAHTCSSQYPTNEALGICPLSVSLCIKPKIAAHDRLILRLDYHVNIIIDTEIELRFRLIDQNQFYRCFHDDRKFKDKCLRILLQAQTESTTYGSNGVFPWHDTRPCAYCATDARVRVSREECGSGSDNQWTLEVQVFKDLGRKIDQPWDQPWRGHTFFCGRVGKLGRHEYPLAKVRLQDVYDGTDELIAGNGES